MSWNRTRQCSAKTTKPPYSSLSILVVVLEHLIVRSDSANGLTLIKSEAVFLDVKYRRGDR
jgi:hypothetical protein